MEYSIEETNLERQHLLAQCLHPISLKALETISLPGGANILDIGCGLGDTTLMLSQRFPDSHVTGLDFDNPLIEAAISEKKGLHVNLDFIHGNALKLPFGDNHFDFVFCRYLLHHITEATQALQEMKRVCKPGGVVFAQEYDFNSLVSYPESDAYPKFLEIVTSLFADVLIGRKMIHYFRQLEVKNICHDAQVILADHDSVLKRFYRLTAKAMETSIIKKGLMTKKEFEEWVNELETIEKNKEAIVLTHPIIAVWGTK